MIYVGLYFWSSNNHCYLGLSVVVFHFFICCQCWLHVEGWKMVQTSLFTSPPPLSLQEVPSLSIFPQTEAPHFPAFPSPLPYSLKAPHFCSLFHSHRIYLFLHIFTIAFLPCLFSFPSVIPPTPRQLFHRLVLKPPPRAYLRFCFSHSAKVLRWNAFAGVVRQNAKCFKDLRRSSTCLLE